MNILAVLMWLWCVCTSASACVCNVHYARVFSPLLHGQQQQTFLVWIVNCSVFIASVITNACDMNESGGGEICSPNAIAINLSLLTCYIQFYE